MICLGGNEIEVSLNSDGVRYVMHKIHPLHLNNKVSTTLVLDRFNQVSFQQAWKHRGLIALQPAFIMRRYELDIGTFDGLQPP